MTELGAQARPVVIVDYDPLWPRQFDTLRTRIAQLLEGLAAAIEHVGSTAVPGLAAKPVIDLDVLLRSASDLPAAISKLTTDGYEHRGDLGIQGREAFWRPPGSVHHHLYVCPPNSPEYRRHIAFRDYLRKNPDTADAYAELKRQLATAHRNDREAYNRGKENFVKDTLERAKFDR